MKARTAVVLSFFVVVSIASATEWKRLAAGFEYASFAGTTRDNDHDSLLHVVRIDPIVCDVRLFSVERFPDKQNRSLQEWCDELDLSAAINAGMYAEDYRRHVGFLQVDGSVIQRAKNSYKSYAAFQPIAPGLPPFRIYDAEEISLDSLCRKYRTVVQNLRLIDRKKQNLWKESGRKWSEAALAEDRTGKLLFLFCEQPYTVKEFNEWILKLPLDIVAAQHLEGGPEAALSIVRPGFVKHFRGTFDSYFFEATSSLPPPLLPNIIGVRVKQRQ